MLEREEACKRTEVGVRVHEEPGYSRPMGDYWKTSRRNEKDREFGGGRGRDAKSKREECCHQWVPRLSLEFRVSRLLDVVSSGDQWSVLM